MAVRLRPHHLLCILTYKGRGYSLAFVANYDEMVRRIAAGEEVHIVSGPDDICAPLLDGDDAHCLRESVTERDRLAARDIGRLLGKPVEERATLVLTADVLAEMRHAFAVVEERAACDGCQWVGLCSEVAQEEYREAHLSTG